MTDRDEPRKSFTDDDFDDFLAEFESTRSPVHEASAPRPKPTAPPPAAAARTEEPDVGVDVSLDFDDDDDDGATRVGQIPLELLAALGRKPVEEPATRPPPPGAAEASTDDDFGGSARTDATDPSQDADERTTLVFDEPPDVASMTARPTPVAGELVVDAVDGHDIELDAPSQPTEVAKSDVVVDEDEDDVVIDAGDDEPMIDAGDDEPVIDAGDDEPVIDAGDDEPVIDAGDDEPELESGLDEEIVLDGDDEPPAARAEPPELEASPVITLEGRAAFAGRARMLIELAEATSDTRTSTALEAAAALAERGGGADTDALLARAGTASARRNEVRRGTRPLETLATDDLGPDVAGARALRVALAASRRGDAPALIAALEEASRIAHLPGLRRFASLELAGALDRAGEARRATDARLRAVADTATPGTLGAIARAQLGQSGAKDAAGTLARAAEGAGGMTALGRALGRWATVLGAEAVDELGDARLATTADRLREAARTDEARAEAAERLAAATSGETRAAFLLELAVSLGRLDRLEEATEAFHAARALSPRSALVDAVRDAESQRLERPDRLPPTPAQDDEEGPLAVLGRALALPEVGPDVVARMLALKGDARVEAALAPVLGDVAANVGDPNTWVDALLADTDPHGATGRAIARAMVLARAGDVPGAIASIDGLEGRLAASARAVLAATSAPARAAEGLLADAAPSLHARALASRLAPSASVESLRALLEALPFDAPIALRLEQAARAAGHAGATAAALDALARLADDEVGRRKFRLLAASDGGAAEALELAPDDPVLLAEALLDPRVPAQVRDRAIAVLSAGATPFVDAILHARAATLAQVDGSPSDAALALRRAHEAIPNEPSLRASVELAELAAEQPARIAHRLFSVARDESVDARTRARAFARLADLDLRERADATAAIASLHAVLELAPDHVPSLRALEALACDRGDVDSLTDLEERLASAMRPGVTADAHARQAIRRRFVAGNQPPSDVANIALSSLARGSRSSRLLRWAEHAARGSAEGFELEALERRLAAANDADERVEIGLRIAAYAEKRGRIDRALGETTRALEIDPGHAVALLDRAFLLDDSGDALGAAAAHEAAAAVAKSDTNARRHYVRAAELRSAIGDAEGSRAALDAALARSPNDPEVIAALVDFHERRGEVDRSLELVDRRLAVGVPDDERARWHRRRAKLAERASRPDVARSAYVELLSLTPDDIEVLRRVAVLSVDAGDGPTAIDAYMRMARLQKEPAGLVEAFLGLGDCYGRLVPDAKRCEASYRRVVQYAPTHPYANDRLAELLRTQKRYDEALAVSEALEKASDSAVQARRIRLDVARACERDGDFRSAEHLLDALRKSAPTDVSIQLELARFFADRGGGPPLSMHLNRAITDLRRSFEENPTEESLLALLDIQGRRGRVDALACFEAAAATLGIARDHSGKPLATSVRAAQRAAHSIDVDTAVAPRSLPDGTRAAMRLASSAIDHVFPFDARAFQAEKLPKDSPIRAEALAVAHWFGFDDVQVLVTPAAPRICVPVSATPLTLVLGRELPLHATETERTFLFARAAKIASLGMSFAVRMQPAQVALAVHSLVHVHDPAHAPAGVDPVALAQTSQSLGKHLARADHELGPLCLEMGTRPQFEPARFGLAAAELGDRVALLATGDLLAGIGGLLRLSGRDLDAETTVAGRLGMVRAMPEAWGLLLFALSDAHAEARQRAGVSGG